jgi:UDP-glucose 4-epimerase
MKKINILVTGVAGFIGSSFVNKLNLKFYNIYGIDDFSSSDKSQLPKKKINFFKKDLSIGLPKKLYKKEVIIDYIYHFAGQSSGELSFKDPKLDLEKNTISTLNLIKFSIEKKIKTFFYMSSMSVYGNTNKANEKSELKPNTCYGVSKLSSEYYLKVFEKELNYVIFRLFNIYGPGQNLNNIYQGMIRIYLTQLIKSDKLNIKGSMNRYRDFVYIDDLVNILISSINKKSLIGQTINIGTGKKTYIRDVVKIIKTLKKKVKVNILNGTKGDQFGIYSNNQKFTKFFPKIKFKNFNEGFKKYFESVMK